MAAVKRGLADNWKPRVLMIMAIVCNCYASAHGAFYDLHNSLTFEQICDFFLACKCIYSKNLRQSFASWLKKGAKLAFQDPVPVRETDSFCPITPITTTQPGQQNTDMVLRGVLAVLMLGMQLSC